MKTKIKDKSSNEKFRNKSNQNIKNDSFEIKNIFRRILFPKKIYKKKGNLIPKYFRSIKLLFLFLIFFYKSII